jgi:hypothetical protein
MGKKDTCRRCHKKKKTKSKQKCPPKEKLDVSVSCQQGHEEGTSVAEKWDLAIIPPAGSSFRPSSGEDVHGQYTVTAGIVYALAEFTALGAGNASRGDILNTRYTLPEPAIPNSVKGFSIYFTVVESGTNSYIKVIQTDIVYDRQQSAFVNVVNITEAGNTSPPASAEYEGWVYIDYEDADDKRSFCH